MEMFKCNGCGKITNSDVQFYSFLLIYPIDRFTLNYERKWHLCTSCFRKFKRFMKADAEETKKNEG